MKNKIIKPSNSIHFNSLLNSNSTESTNNSSKFSHQMLKYYKRKSQKLENDFENLLDVLDQVKSTCDYSFELQSQLSERNEEIFKLQQIIGELQIHLFKEKEQNIKLSAENDELKIQICENTKRIEALLAVTGICERKYMHFITTSSQDKLIQPKLPSKLQKLRDVKQKETVESTGLTGDVDHTVLVLNNQLLASQLEQHIKLSKDEISVLLKEKELTAEERIIERQRLHKEIDLLAAKLKEGQELLCETTEKLVKAQQEFEKEKTKWMVEKEKYLQVINQWKAKEGFDASDAFACSANRSGGGRGSLKECGASEKDEMNAVYQEQILALEAEVNRLRERAQICKNKFKEKTEKMTAQVSYLKNKYEDLDRRRLLEAEGFRTDIRMLRERVKELEKKLTKASVNFQSNEQKLLLISARSTLNRAKQLEKELAYMKSKISLLESNEEAVS